MFYRIYKSKKHNNNNNEINLIKEALVSQPFVKLSSDECRKIMEPNGSNKSKSSGGHEKFFREREVFRMRDDAPRHDLKIIIAKKPSSKNKFSCDSVKSGSHNKARLNKPNSNGSSSSSSNDFERLRGNVDNSTSSVSSSEIASTSEMKTTLSKKSGTVSHHDLKLENKSNTKRHNNNDSHDFYEFTMNEERGKEKQKRESMKHTNSSSSLSSSYYSSHSPPQQSSAAAMGRNQGKVKEKSSLQLNIPKLKIELPSLKTKITVPKTPNESYSISKSPFSNNAKCEPQLKKVRFDMSSNTVYSSSSTFPSVKSNRSLYDFDDETEENSCVDQKKYAAKIGLKPVERKVESIILQRKRKKSKHSKDFEHSSKRPKLHVSSSLDESLKLKLKIMGGKNCKSDKKFNEEEAYERTCNLKAVHCKTADLSSINVHEVRQQHKKQQQQAEKAKEAEIGHKYSVTEQKITKTSSSSDSNQPMVFIPKLVLQKATSTTNVSTFTLSTSPTSSSSLSLNKSSSKKEEEATTQVQRRNSILSDQEHKLQQQQQKRDSREDINKSQDIKIKIKPLDKLAADPSNQKLMKPPTAKMGSPSSDIQAQISSTLASSPIRPNSIPASLKLSPISPSYSIKNDLKRSLSTGAEKSPHCYINPYAKSNTEMFTREPPLVKIPPLIPTTQTIRNFYNATIANNHNNEQTARNSSTAPVTISKVPNINVKDPIKLFPNACPSVEILKIPQAAPIVNQEPLVKNIKLNRPMPPTIPLVKIKQTAQNPSLQKILPKSSPQQFNSNQNLIRTPNYQDQKMNLPHRVGSNGSIDNESFRNEICPSPISQSDLSLARYHFELSKDIAKLDHSLSLEKNFEDWMKKQEFSKSNFTASQSIRNLMNQQMNLSVRNIPNPSALMMFRNQNNNNAEKLNSASKSPTSTTVSSPSPSRMVISSTSEHPDIEEVITKSTISKGTERPFFSENNNLSNKSAINKINDKKSIEKLTEYLRLTAAAATAAQSKEVKQDDDNNNIPSSKNDKNFNLIDTNSIVGQKSSSMDVICIDS